MSTIVTPAQPRWTSVGLWIVKGLVALAFVSAGAAKLYGVPMLVEEFLICIMIGAVITHLFVIGGSPVPAIVLLALNAVVAYAERSQIASLAKTL